MTEELSVDYEQVREDNIKRNKQFLDEIFRPEDFKVPIRNNHKAKATAASYKKQVMEVAEGGTDLYSNLLRRSSRIATNPLPDYKDIGDVGVARNTQSLGLDRKSKSKGKSTAPSAEKIEAIESLKRKRDDPAVIGTMQPGSADTRSCRDITADVDYFLKESVLGFPMDSFGKKAVMAAANGGVTPKFSKYNGVAEWKNAIFLWINIDPESDYPNEFLEGGKAITWFGGSRMKAESPLTARLLGSVGSELSGGASNNGDIVLLFVRVPGGNYISLGRVSCQMAYISSHPVRITWALKDYERLITQSIKGGDEKQESSACQNFRDIILAAANEENG